MKKTKQNKHELEKSCSPVETMGASMEKLVEAMSQTFAAEKTREKALLGCHPQTITLTGVDVADSAIDTDDSSGLLLRGLPVRASEPSSSTS